MPQVTREHFERAAADIGAHGDNDTLPFDIDNRFIKSKQEDLVDVAFDFYSVLAKGNAKAARTAIDSASVFSERLLTPAGPSGFRIVTKMHPFWCIYFNGLAIAVGEALEPERSEHVYSYRFQAAGEDLFSRDSTWRTFRLSSIDDAELGNGVVVQTDISGFYEHVYHHRLENLVKDLLSDDGTVATQIDRLLSRLAAGRSFGLPVGGQGSRILAEALLSPIDQQLDELRLKWRRYVDDYVLIAPNHAEAYRAISVLSNALADYGLTLNRTKTTVLSAKHYRDYVHTQLGLTGDESQKLVEIDLYFDPYSDDPYLEFEELKDVVESLDIARLLNLELSKSQPDSFLVAQISRTLQLHEPVVAMQLCSTLLSSSNLHAFRASWATLMRGIAAVRANLAFSEIFEGLDKYLDAILNHSSHLLMAETSCLHYLRTIRFKKTAARAEYVMNVYSNTKSQTVRRACIDCWRNWKHRSSFTRERNQWNSLPAEVQRMLYFAATEFDDEGAKFRDQVRRHVEQEWKLGIERQGKKSFASIFRDWDAT